jgi:hypothetical protein
MWIKKVQGSGFRVQGSGFWVQGSMLESDRIPSTLNAEP